jgi:hypothetical protein
MNAAGIAVLKLICLAYHLCEVKKCLSDKKIDVFHQYINSRSSEIFRIAKNICKI